MTLPPPPEPIKYNKRKHGYFGQLGTGANAEIRFLQTALDPDELDHITLIENIPGSETWDVKDLFQRDVDKERVTHDILPYFKDPDQLKFFNPLTLVLLPLQEDGGAIQEDLPFVPPSKHQREGHPYLLFERPTFFRFEVHEHTPAYSALEWNDRTVRVVAVDGQHRLSALKRWKNEAPQSSAPLASWTIPVVILGAFRATEEKQTASLLEVVRRTFVYINSKAERIHPAREILLDDESVVAICTQELIQEAHRNDCLPVKERLRTRTPLILFDWRGEVRNNERVPAPAALKPAEEIRDWLGWYVLGDDGSQDQELALILQDLMPPLSTFGPDKTLSHEDARRVRTRVHETLLPALQFLLEEFGPYKQYIAACRDLEEESLRKSDLAQHAFMRLRFGTSRASEDILAHVNAEYEDLVNTFTELKGRLLDELLVRDIGMRGVMSAFGYGKIVYDDAKERTTPWTEFASWFTEALNRVYESGWFRSFAQLDTRKRNILAHVTFDPSGAIVNYKFESQDQGFGALLAILVFHEGRSDVSDDCLATIWDDCSEALRVPLRAGYRKQVKAELQETFKGTVAEFKNEANKRANALVEKHLHRIERYLQSESK